MYPPSPNRLLIVIVSGSQVDILMTKLSQENFRFTVIDSSGNPIQEPRICLLIGFHTKQQESLFELIRNNCQPYRRNIPAQGLLVGESANLPMLEAQLGGALIYLMNVERFEQL